MTLQATSKLANIVGSVQKFMSDEFAVTFPNAIDFGGGVEFSDATLAEWLQVRMLEASRPDDGIGPRAPKGTLDSESPFGREMIHLLNINIFVRPKKMAVRNNLRLLTLRDLIADKFTPVSGRIEVKNYADDNASLGYLVVEALDADRLVSDPAREPELLQHNLVIAFRWTETWT